jgi:sulfur carrier protein ThiS
MRLYLGGHLDFYHPQRHNWLEIAIENPTPLQELLTDLGIPLGEVHLVVINGEALGLQDAVVTERDEVKMYSAVDGG